MYITTAINTNRKQTFTSYKSREDILKELARITEQVQQKCTETKNIIRYPEIQDFSCKDMTKFMLNFCCETLNNSTHKIEEFFGSDKVAAEFRQKLSPKCQQDSLEIRNSIMATKTFTNPIHALISANNMKKFIPEKDALSQKQLLEVVDTAKKTYIDLVKNADLSDFTHEDKATINELTSRIENSSGVDFGDDYEVKLKALIEKLNNKSESQQALQERQRVFAQDVLVQRVQIRE